jgi:hypothetical protein
MTFGIAFYQSNLSRRSAYRTGCYPESVVGLLERNAVTALPPGAQHLGVHCPGVQGHADHPRHLSSLHQRITV